MEGPGMSLFQGAASIHINNSAQDRLEEQEELEDQKRRNEELKHKLANAFDDLLDDDEASSVNSSGNFTLDAAQNNGQQTRTGLPPTYIESLNHLKEQASESPKSYCETPKNHLPHTRQQEEPVKLQFSPYGAGDGQNHYYQQDFRGHLNGINNYDARQEYMNNEQLKVMYEMRVKECQQLATQLEGLDGEVQALRARLAASLADRDKAELSLQEAHHIIASSKHTLIELEQQVHKLTQKLVESEQDKEQLKIELRSANTSLQDVQQRLHTMQVAHTHDTDALFREQQDRHREEMNRLENDLMKAKSRLDEKDNEIKALERRCKEREKEKEEVLIEKGATINRLAGELEQAQGRLAGGGVARLRERAAHLAAERNAARDQVKELGSKLEVTAHELVLCRSELAASRQEHELWRAALRQVLLENMPDNAYMGEPPSPGKLTTLKEVLTRYKIQIQKMSSLQEEINKRDKKLEQHRKQESELRSTVEEQKGTEVQLQSRVAVLQSKLELLASSGDDELLDSCKQRNEHLNNELENVRAELKNLELKYAELEMENERVVRERDSRAELVRELERCSARLKDAFHENGELKNLYLQACSARESVSRELKDVQARVQNERELFKSQEKELVERSAAELAGCRAELASCRAELASCRAELAAARARVAELQRDFADKQKEFTAKLDKYLHEEKNAMRKEMEACAQCEKQAKHVKCLEEQLNKCTLKLASQESNEALMKELKSKAEFFQQYIMERFRKLHEQRSVGTSTEARAPDAEDDVAPHSDDDMAARVWFLQQCIMERFRKLHEQRSVGTSTEAGAPDAEDDVAPHSDDAMAARVRFLQQYIMERFRKLHEQRSVGTSTEARAPDAEDDVAPHSDDAMAARVQFLQQYIVELFRKLHEQRSVGTSTEARAPDAEDDVAPHSDDAMAARVRFLQQYIMERFRKLQQRSVGTSTEARAPDAEDDVAPYSDDAMAARVRFLQQYIVERFRKLHEQRSVGTSTEARAPDAEDDVAPHSDDAMAARVRFLQQYIMERFRKLQQRSVGISTEARAPDAEDDVAPHSDDAMAARVRFLQQYIVERFRKLQQRSVGTSTEARAPDAEDDVAPHSDDAMAARVRFLQQYIMERFRKLQQRSVGTSTEARAPDAEDDIAPHSDDAMAARVWFLQQYIMERFRKLQQRSVGTSTEARAPDAEDDVAPHSDDAMAAKTALMMKEKAIRDQIAEKFTLEMKTMEMDCMRKIKEIKNEQMEAISKLKELLERKAQEVETLKEFIIAERGKVTQVLESKENEISVLIKEHNEIQAEWHKAKDCAQEWKIKAEKYKERASRLGSVEDVLKSERSCAKECHSLKAKMAELQDNLSKLEDLYEKLQMDHQTVQDKYRNAKKMIFTYKDYISKKDAHVSGEMSRIQDEYRKIFLKLQSQIDYHVTCRLREERARPHAASEQHHAEVSERLSQLNEDIARLAHSNFKDGPELNGK